MGKVICPGCGTEWDDDIPKCTICGYDLSTVIQERPRKIGRIFRVHEDGKGQTEEPADNKESNSAEQIRSSKKAEKSSHNRKGKFALPVIVIIAGCIGLGILYSNGVIGGGTDPDTAESSENTENTYGESGAVEDSNYAVALECSDKSTRLKIGESREITVTVSGEDIPDNYSLYAPDSFDHIEWKWGDWTDDHTATATITALSEGIETVRVTLNEFENGDKVYADTYVDVVINSEEDAERDEAHYIVSSADILHLSVGESKEITISAEGTDLPESYAFRYSYGDICKGEWGDWNGNSSVITITGLSAGTERDKFILLDGETEEEIAYTYVDIVVE